MPFQDTYGTGEITLASYDFYDLVAGTGYKKFYLVDLLNGVATALTYIKVNQIYPNAGYMDLTSGTIDFDLTFDTPITLDGNAYVNVFVSSPSTFSKQETVTLYHYDGTTQTQLGSTVGSTLGVSNSTIAIAGSIAIPVKRFAAGDILRLRVTVEATATGNRILCHPYNVDVSGAAVFLRSDSHIILPIKI